MDFLSLAEFRLARSAHTLEKFREKRAALWRSAHGRGVILNASPAAATPVRVPSSFEAPKAMILGENSIAPSLLPLQPTEKLRETAPI
ncbi:hypothetical protein HMI49_26510 [Corallococcus exercitus]|uniref:Uncharacterized protein n=1 Tax=Corallococcus exercitus TaxID=2316736 RepID=A0A7Y4KN15_9BACT|nr:hypothetical protein [Corallococcus exercitus]NOK36766.1 hypothetical protein [Corallococcus exercitus]